MQAESRGVALTERIDTALAAINTQNVASAKNITESGATLEDIPLLKGAIEDIEAAFALYSGNYTANEKQGAERDLDHARSLLSELNRAKLVQDTMDALPDAHSVTPNMREANEACQTAREQYADLSDAEKRYVDASRLEALELALSAYRIIEGDGSIWKRNRRNEPVFKTNGLAEKIVGVTIDGIVLVQNAYTVNEDGSVSISTAFLRAEKRGEKTVVVRFRDGQATASFTVKASLTWLWVLLLISFLLLILCVAVLYLYEKERAKMRRRYPPKRV